METIIKIKNEFFIIKKHKTLFEKLLKRKGSFKFIKIPIYDKNIHKPGDIVIYQDIPCKLLTNKNLTMCEVLLYKE